MKSALVPVHIVHSLIARQLRWSQVPVLNPVHGQKIPVLNPVHGQKTVVHGPRQISAHVRASQSRTLGFPQIGVYRYMFQLAQ